jgi:hypothetical protein
MTPEKFMDGVVVEESGCWGHATVSPTKGARAGYRLYSHSAHKRVAAHRVVYEELRGEIPSGLTLDHLCRNRGCLNPWHLEPVAMKENLLRGKSFVAVNARKAHCPKGHEYDIVLSTGSRWCRECSNQAQREYMERKRSR